MKKFWPFAFYFWQYAGIAFMMPFLVLFYQSLGFNGGQIGVLAGLSPLITLICTPLWTGLADATHRHRVVLSISLLGSILAVIAFPFFSSFLAILLILTLSSIFAAPISPLADSAAISMLGDEKDQYGKLRLGGTFGFAIGAPLAGFFIQSYGLRMAFWGCALMYFLALAASQMFVHESAAAAAKRAVPVAGGLRLLLTRPRFLLFLAGAFVGGLALAVTNNYFFSYMKELGATQTSMGIALALGTVCEVPVLFFGNSLLRYFKAYPLFVLALLLTCARLVLFYLAGNPIQVMVIQVLTGMVFPAMWIAGVSYADEHAPAGMKASAQGVFNVMVFGVGTALGGFVGGALLESIGARGMYLTFGMACLLIMAVILLVSRFLPSEKPLGQL